MGFWKYVKAGLVAELLSKIFFSGKIPLPIFLALGIGIFALLCGYWWILLIIWVFTTSHRTKEGRIRQIYKKTACSAEFFEDTISPLVFEGDIGKFSITTPFGKLHFAIHSKTELLRIWYEYPNRQREILPYEYLIAHVPNGIHFSLHRDMTEYAYRVIRTNIL